jgi:hypothetical protein
VSELEQSLSCDDKKDEHYRALCTKLDDARVSAFDSIRLVMLFALRYEASVDRTQVSGS